MFNLSKIQKILFIIGTILALITGIILYFFLNQSTQSTIKVINGNANNIQISGNKVEIIGPSKFINKRLNCKLYPGRVGNGAGIVWGDGTYGTDCKNIHTYNVPGTYTISLALGHLGPVDKPIIDWKENIEIMVQSTEHNLLQNKIENIGFK